MEQENSRARRRFKDDLYESFARMGQALASPKRLEILDLLSQAERTVQSLAEEMETSVANASQHLQTLKEARLVTVRREGTYAHYQLADPAVFHLWRALRELARDRLPEIPALVETRVGPRGDAVAEASDEIFARAAGGEVVLLDVRPTEEHAWAHLPHALSIPLDELDARAGELPTDREILVYCRGPLCTYSDEAVSILQSHGRAAQRLEPGAPDWILTQAPSTPVPQEVHP